MSSPTRKTLIAANWKMYKTPAESVSFTRAFIPLAGRHPNTEVVLCPSPTSLAAVVEAAAHNPIRVAAQDMHWLDQGAYTGETSPLMLKAIGVTGGGDSEQLAGLAQFLLGIGLGIEPAPAQRGAAGTVGARREFELVVPPAVPGTPGSVTAP